MSGMNPLIPPLCHSSNHRTQTWVSVTNDARRKSSCLSVTMKSAENIIANSPTETGGTAGYVP